MWGGWQDVVHPLHGVNNNPHYPERVSIFPPSCLVIPTVVKNGIMETLWVCYACPTQCLAFDGSNVFDPRLDANSGRVFSGHVATG